MARNIFLVKIRAWGIIMVVFRAMVKTKIYFKDRVLSINMITFKLSEKTTYLEHFEYSVFNTSLNYLNILKVTTNELFKLNKLSCFCHVF